jgi:hypothetical protein
VLGPRFDESKICKSQYSQDKAGESCEGCEGYEGCESCEGCEGCEGCELTVSFKSSAIAKRSSSVDEVGSIV